MDLRMIECSALETELFGLRVGRCNQPSLQPAPFLEEIKEGNYDVVRLQVPAADPELVTKLHQMGLPCFLNGVVQFFVTPATAFELKPMINPDIEFEPYTPARRQEVKRAIEICFGDQALGYYDVPYFSPMILKDRQVEVLSRFFVDKLEEDPSYRGWAVFLAGKFAGYTITVHHETEHFTISGGILPEFRNRKAFRDMVRFVQNHGRITGLDTLSGVRIQNVLSQKHLISEGMTLVGGKVIYYLTPFLGIQRRSLEGSSVMKRKEPIETLRQYLAEHYSGMQLQSVQFRRFSESLPDRFSFQVLMEQRGKLVGVAGFGDAKAELVASAWIELVGS